jgi:hypothetical protein
MKITPPSTPPSPETNPVSKIEGKENRDFAAKLDQSRSIQEVELAKSQPPTQIGKVTDIATDLEAGRCTKTVALERVLERVLDQRLGSNAPAAVREQVGAALRAALVEDPLLAAKIASLH